MQPLTGMSDTEDEIAAVIRGLDVAELVGIYRSTAHRFDRMPVTDPRLADLAITLTVIEDELRGRDIALCTVCRFPLGAHDDWCAGRTIETVHLPG